MGLIKSIRSRFSTKAMTILTVTAAALSAAPALAEGPPDLAAITFPVSHTSIATQVATIGGTVLLVTFPLIVGFALAKKVMRRAKSAV